MNVSLDIETLSTSKRGVVLSIGAWAFDENAKERRHGAGFHVVLDRREQITGGRAVDADTCRWWLTEPPDAALRALCWDGPASVCYALALFRTWLECNGPVDAVWCKGPAFDGAILEDLCEWAGVPCPITYRQWRDVRTILDVAWKLVAPEEEPLIHEPRILHHALEDAVAQGLDVAAALRRIGG